MLLSTYQGEILCVDLKRGSVQHLNDQLENKKTLSLKQYISKLNDFNILKVCSQQHVAVIQKEKTKIEIDLIKFSQLYFVIYVFLQSDLSPINKKKYNFSFFFSKFTS